MVNSRKDQINKNKELGLKHQALIKQFLVQYPGITRRELAALLQMDYATINGHVTKIRWQWFREFMDLIDANTKPTNPT